MTSKGAMAPAAATLDSSAQNKMNLVFPEPHLFRCVNWSYFTRVSCSFNEQKKMRRSN